MTENLQDSRSTLLALMNVTRRQWQVNRHGQKIPMDKETAYAWPTGGIRAARREDEQLERFLREQE